MRRIALWRRGTDPSGATVDAVALLLGTTVEHLLDVWNPADGAQALPADLQRKGQKRAKAARDATGDNAGNECVAFWAVYEWGARIDWDEAAQVMWAVIDEPFAGTAKGFGNG
jgi:hypothetical protein